MLNQLIETVLKTFSQMGVTLTNINVDHDPPEYYIQLDIKNLIQPKDDTLKSVYGILWTLTYGKLSDENRNNKIILYYVEAGEKSANN